MRFFLAALRRSHDALTLSMITLVVGVSVWILAMPVCRPIQSATLGRFHLCTPTYMAWAAQQPIPSMYNFENRYWLFAGSAPEDGSEVARRIAEDQWLESRVVNHFPGRLLTFGDGRYRLLGKGESCHLVLRSCYRGNQLATVWSASASPRGGFDLSRTAVVEEWPR